jgi:hypothetical protein
VPTASAITQARKRLGRRAFPELFECTCGPVAGDASPVAGMHALGTARGSFLRGWRLLAIDGFEVDVPDTKVNAAEFGYAGSGENRSAFPKARVVALAECGAHAFVAAEAAPAAAGTSPRYSAGVSTGTAHHASLARRSVLAAASSGKSAPETGTAARAVINVLI